MVKKSDIQTLLEDGPEQAAQLPERREMDRAPLVRPAGHARRRDNGQFEVVWSGIGPLPGEGGAAGLGSTLSGIRFSIGKRG